MKKIYNPDRKQWEEFLERPSSNTEAIERTVARVFSEVRSKGDSAVREYSLQYDGISPRELMAGPGEIEAAKGKITVDLKQAIALAKANIEKFHEAQRKKFDPVVMAPGVTCWQENRPIQKVGLYIPGGTAPLFSTILMLAIPAQLAGCQEIILCSPPDATGNLHPAILYTAALCGVRTIYKIGGIQAIAAMTFGTGSIQKVDKIFGPGNQFVTVAKQMATRFNTAIDLPAGPSELMVIADASADPQFVAADLLSQAEHGPDSQVLLVSLSKEMLTRVEEEVILQLDQLPRKEIAREAIKNSRLIYLPGREEALEMIDQYGPEHLIICTSDARFFVQGVCNAGSVFIGNNSPESAGDYASGTNHTLPTSGYARQYSGVTLDSFQKTISFQEISEEGIRQIGPAIERMAEEEGLEAHKRAVSFRLNALKSSEI